MIRLVAIVALILFGSACSRTELAYRHADWLLEYYARKTVAASADQREDWQPVLAATLHNHREQELPFIIAYLDLMEDTLTRTVNAAGAECLVDGVLLLSQRHARLAVELAVPLLADLDDEQISHLREYLAKRQVEATRKYLNPDTGHRKLDRQERFAHRIIAWTGRLSDGQTRLLADALERIPDLSTTWLAYRTQQADRLLQLLDNHADAATLRAYLTEWWVEQEGRSPEYRRLWHTSQGT